MTGLPLKNPSPQTMNQKNAVAIATNSKDPYADMGTMVNSPDKRAKEQKLSSNVAMRSFLLEHKNGSIVSLDGAKGLKGGEKNPYAEMGFAIDFPDKKSKSKKAGETDEQAGKVSAFPERRMIKKNGDPYSDVGSSPGLTVGKDQTHNKRTESGPVPENFDLTEITANLNKLIEKAKEISLKPSEGQRASTQEKAYKMEAGNATVFAKDPYADVGSLSKKSTKSISGTKKDLKSLVEDTFDEEFQNDSNVKTRTAEESSPKQISGNSVTGVVVTKNVEKMEEVGKPQEYKKKDPYSDVGSTVDVKE